MLNRLILSMTLIAGLALAGCTTPTASQKAELIKPREGFNFLGVVSYEAAAFKRKNPSSFGVSSHELIMRENMSGDNLSLLWGAIQFNDY